MTFFISRNLVGFVSKWPDWNDKYVIALPQLNFCIGVLDVAFVLAPRNPSKWYILFEFEQAMSMYANQSMCRP